jgi:4-coumarate--CoA ligase
MNRLFTNKPYDAELAIHLIKKYKVTMLFLPPPQTKALLKIATKKDLESIKTFFTGAAVISDFMLGNIQAMMPKAEVANAYGMSEAGLIYRKAVGCKPFVPDNVLVKIVDQERKPLGINQKGVIMAHPQFKFLGYCNAPEKTEAMYKDGWIYTGDYGFMNELGELTIIDRFTELIKCGDETVCLTDIEQVLERIEALSEICVVGVPDKEKGHILAALVKKDSDSKLTADEIFKITAEKLPPNKQLHGGVFFSDDLPKTTSGKILRRIVREIIAEKIRGTSRA